MVVPTVQRITYQIHMKRVILRKLVLGIADGVLMVDNKPIYQANDLKVGLIQAAPPTAA